MTIFELFLLEGTTKGPGLGSMIFPFAIMIAIFYFMLIRPQQRKQKDQDNMLSKVKAGDTITTIGGIKGTVNRVEKATIILEVFDKSKIEFAINSIAKVDSNEDNGKKDTDNK
ncbi:MAG: preprotein translocase subunit YajC [Lentisphaeria bacterium]|nr:preprotein translocase subunit YajC [Lentisphaeria bacterium]NQZ70783.1 preprotein translocase subunit YajC [Lentisphaeria bacterium]